MGLVNNQRAYDQHLLSDSGAENIMVNGVAIGYRFTVRMPNFRGNYLSCVEQLDFTLDGAPIDGSAIELLLNDKRFRIADLPSLFMEYWDVLDSAIIEVECPGGLYGERAIGVTMKLRYAYSSYFGKCKVVTSHIEKRLTFANEGG